MRPLSILTAQASWASARLSPGPQSVISAPSPVFIPIRLSHYSQIHGPPCGFDHSKLHLQRLPAAP